jgi:uncharacterized damage-inducible protein DinB
MKILKENRANLMQVHNLVSNLSQERYTTPSRLLNGSTIGQHLRHIVEFYACIVAAGEHGEVCYDKRERDKRLENDPRFALSQLLSLSSFLDKLDRDRPMQMVGNYGTSAEGEIQFNSSLQRELAYAIDHTVHHLAIIKIALVHEFELKTLSENMGVAPSTIRHKTEKACVQ